MIKTAAESDKTLSLFIYKNLTGMSNNQFSIVIIDYRIRRAIWNIFSNRILWNTFNLFNWELMNIFNVDFSEFEQQSLKIFSVVESYKTFFFQCQIHQSSLTNHFQQLSVINKYEKNLIKNSLFIIVVYSIEQHFYRIYENSTDVSVQSSSTFSILIF